MFSKSFKEFIRNPIITLPNIAFALLSQVILYFLITRNSFLNGAYSKNFSASVSPLDPKAAAMFLATFLLLILIFIFTSPIVLSWTYSLCKRVVKGETFDLFRDFRHSLKHYWRVLGTTVLMGLIYFAVYMAFIFIIALTVSPILMSVNSKSLASIGVLGGLLALFLIFLFIVIIIFLAICFSPVLPLIIYDDLNIGTSISRGFKLGLKKFFPILGVFSLVMVFNLFIYFILYFIFGSNSIILTIVYTLINSYAGLFPIIYIMNIYENDKQRKANNYPQYQYPVYNSQPQMNVPDSKWTPSEETPVQDNKPDEPDNNFKI